MSIGFRTRYRNEVIKNVLHGFFRLRVDKHIQLVNFKVYIISRKKEKLKYYYYNILKSEINSSKNLI